MKGKVAEETCLEVGHEELGIEVTTYCNSACLHCFARTGMARASHLSLDLVKKIIAEGYDTGYRHLHITGGEPLLWQGLFEALEFGFECGYEEVSMNTNGTLLSDDACKRLEGYRGLSISVSLEGTEALHDALRGDDSYWRAVMGIERALNVGIDLVLFTTLRKSLLPTIPYFVDHAYKRFSGIKYLTFIQLIRVINDAFTLSDELLEPEDFLQMVKTVALMNLYGLCAIVKNNPLTDIVSERIGMPWIPRVHPLYGNGSMVIMANRDISLLHSMRDSFGNYMPGMIQKVLASESYQKAVAPDSMTCPSCKHVELCRDNNMVRPSEGYWDLRTDIPYCQRVLDMVAP